MRILASLIFVASFASIATADFSVQVLKESPPTDELAEEIAAQLASTGFTVKRSETSTLCNIWFCKSWNVPADFKATSEVLYPFQPGQLVGVIEYKRRGEDFREQDINRGVYTLRYAQQPIDGNHEGTSPTRDFLLVVNAEKDKSAAVMDVRKLYTASAEAAESSHPGLLLMQAVPADAEASAPSIRSTDDEWEIVRLAGEAVAGDAKRALVMDLVVVGHADE